MSTLIWVFRNIRIVNPALSISSLLVSLIASLVPALSVWSVQQLGNADSGAQIWPIVLVAVVFGLANGAQQVNYALSRKLALRVEVGCANKLNQRLIQCAPIDFWAEEQMQQILAARQCITEKKTSSALQGIINICLAVVTVVTLLICLWDISAAGAIVAVLAVFPIMASYAWYGAKESQMWPELSKHARRAKYFEEELSNPRSAVELLAINGGKFFAKKSRHSENEHAQIQNRLENYAVASDLIAGTISTICLLSSLVIFVTSNRATPINLAACVAGVLSGMTAIAGLGYQVGELASALPAVSQMRSWLESKSEAVNADDQQLPGELCPAALVARNISVSYPKSKNIVNDITLEVSKGVITALVGANGAGKTSLVRALSGLITPSAGNCVLQLVDGHQLLPDSSNLCLLGQDFGRYELTVREYLQLGVGKPKTDQQLWQALRTVRLADQVAKLSGGLDAQLGTSWGGVDLSGGQWQKIAIARLFILDRPIWI